MRSRLVSTATVIATSRAFSTSVMHGAERPPVAPESSTSPRRQWVLGAGLCWTTTALHALGLVAPARAAATTPRAVEQAVVDATGNVVGRVTRLTGEGTGLTFPSRDISDEVFGDRATWPSSPPFSKDDFRRLDESDDALFYPETAPKFVYHIDEGAVAALTNYYKINIPDRSDIIDVCSSWVSHYPSSFPNTMRSIVGVGINANELRNNAQLTSFTALDLNVMPISLPFADDSFDVATCVVSIDYLTSPVQVLKEVRRVLRKAPTSKVIISQSNRLFFTKAIRMWLGMSDLDHLELIGKYLQYAGFEGEPRAFDISAKGRGAKDPMFVVECSPVAAQA